MSELLVTAPILALLLLAPLTIAFLVMFFGWLWNMTMPEVFGLKRITFWQALRLLILVAVLLLPVAAA